MAIRILGMLVLVTACTPTERDGRPAPEPVTTTTEIDDARSWSAERDDIVWADGYNDICVLVRGDIECRGVGMQPSRSGPFLDFDVDRGTSGCAIRPDHTLECWGDHPAALSPPDVPVMDVVMGDWHACVLDMDGLAHCWGQGQGVLAPPPIPFVELDSGSEFVCGREDLGMVRCWGDVDIEPNPGPFADIGLGGVTACGVDFDGVVDCFYGETPDVPVGAFEKVQAGSHTSCGVAGEAIACWGPIPLEGSPPFDLYRDVMLNGFVGCGWTVSDEIRCWGYNISDQGASPTGVFEQVTAGGEASCTLDAQGSVDCWGRDFEGGLADANAAGAGWTDVSTSGFATCIADTDGRRDCFGRAREIPDDVVEGLSTASNHACGLDDLGGGHCWGQGYGGMTNVPDHLGPWTQVDAGYVNSCGIRASNGELVCWGSANNGALDPPAGAFRDLAAAGAHFCAIEVVTDQIHCWGHNHAGQIDAPAGAFLDVDADGSHTCAVDLDGQLHCWGTNGYGESDPPAGTFVSVSVGTHHGCALRPDGTVACWGVDDTPFD